MASPAHPSMALLARAAAAKQSPANLGKEATTKAFDTECYALWDLPGGRAAPFGLLRVEGPVVSRWLPGKETWVEAPQERDYLIGNEPGARRISSEKAEEPKKTGVLAELADEVFAIICTFKPHGG